MTARGTFCGPSSPTERKSVSPSSFSSRCTDTAPSAETVAAYEGYRALTGQVPPNAERFGGIGRFVVVFRRREVTTSEDLVKRFAEERAHDATVLETITRLERDYVSGIALVDGIAERDRLLEALSQDERYSIDAVQPLTSRIVEAKRRFPSFAGTWNLRSQVPPPIN